VLISHLSILVFHNPYRKTKQSGFRNNTIMKCRNWKLNWMIWTTKKLNNRLQNANQICDSQIYYTEASRLEKKKDIDETNWNSIYHYSWRWIQNLDISVFWIFRLKVIETKSPFILRLWRTAKQTQPSKFSHQIK
jgi:hypothetical protein